MWKCLTTAMKGTYACSQTWVIRPGTPRHTIPLYGMAGLGAKAVGESRQTKKTFAGRKSCLRSLLKWQKVKTIE